MNKALFLDLDHTLIKTKSGQTFPTDIFDWELIENTVNNAIGFQSIGYKIIIVTNQGGIELGHMTKEDFNTKMDMITAALDKLGLYIDAWYYCSKMKSYNRKPNPGMAYNAALKFELDLSRSIMVGDMPTDLAFKSISGIGQYYDVDDIDFKF